MFGIGNVSPNYEDSLSHIRELTSLELRPTLTWNPSKISLSLELLKLFFHSVTLTENSGKISLFRELLFF